jgi:hypothetical protein
MKLPDNEAERLSLLSIGDQLMLLTFQSAEKLVPDPSHLMSTMSVAFGVRVGQLSKRFDFTEKEHASSVEAILDAIRKSARITWEGKQ